ncbi:palmitoyltransferase pfa5 [Histoplasma ohiense]|nr:palmitoyltransferase pfa5 [Histoplasma ohiense (nom. inval.)]
MACDPKAANLAVSRVIPVLLGLILIYTCWTFTRSLCIEYLLDSTTSSRNPRIGVTIGLLVAFYILLIALLVSYLRLLVALIWNPDYIPRGPQYVESLVEAKSSKRRSKSRRRRAQNSNKGSKDEEWHGLGAAFRRPAEIAYPVGASGLEAFYLKDVFVCKEDGRPAWCSTCYQFKADRAHHCREVGRCIRKMDHFCPWVGGVVSESSFKFFIQFLFYALLFTIFNLVVFAIFVAERREETGTLIAHWIVALGLGTLFGLLSLGMLGSSIQLACINSSTIESLDRRTKVWTLAILIPPSIKFNGGGTEAQAAPNFPVVSFSSPFGVFSPPQNTSEIDGPDLLRRDFAILHTKPGENPWDLGSPLENFKEVMGYSFLDWFSPLKNSPCTDHNSQESAFRLGPVVRRLRREAGLESCDDGGELTSHNEAHRNRDRGINGEPNKMLKTPSSRKPRKIEQKARPIQKPPNTHRGKHIRHEQNPSGSF